MSLNSPAEAAPVNSTGKPAGEPGPKGVYIQTFGCQMNQYDTAKILEQLRGENYLPVASPQGADLILVNTCAIREKSEHKVYSLLGRLSEIKASRPEVVIGVGGCVAQQRGGEILQKARSVDLVFGTDNLFELPAMLAEVAAGGRPVRTEWRHRKQKVANFIPDFPPPGKNTTLTEQDAGQDAVANTVANAVANTLANPETPGFSGFAESGIKTGLAITKGCNNFCTFCVVPYTRGREVSREAGNILAEARAMVARGVREITLLGQNVNSYRAGGINFVELLHGLNDVEGLERIRYTSPHPKDFNEELLLAHRELEKLCEHVHLPVQSGSDRILKAMRRNHKIDTFLEKTAMIRREIPGASISTDIIVGFPGEEECDFQDTLRLVQEVEFDHLYGFKYSPRTGTPAAEMPGQVPEPVRAERLERLFEAHHGHVRKHNRALIGSQQQVLVEAPHPREIGAMNGRTRGNKPVMVMDSNCEPGGLLNVEIVSARKYSLVAREHSRGCN